MVGPHVRVLSLEGELPVDLVFGSASGNPIRRQEYRPQEFLFLWTYGEVRRRKKKKISIVRRMENSRTKSQTRRGRGGKWRLSSGRALLNDVLFLLDSTTVAAGRANVENGKKKRKKRKKKLEKERNAPEK